MPPANRHYMVKHGAMNIFFRPFRPSFFLGTLIFYSHIPNKNPPAYCLFDFLDLTTDFLDFLDLKNFLNRLKTLKKHLFSLQIDEKNNIFNFRFYSKKLP